MPLEQAALLGCAALTGVGAALFAARVEPGSSVLVVGAGGVGQFIVQGARIAGAAEIVCVDPLERAAQAGSSARGDEGLRPDELEELMKAELPAAWTTRSMRSATRRRRTSRSAGRGTAAPA